MVTNTFHFSICGHWVKIKFHPKHWKRLGEQSYKLPCPYCRV